jgi:hypothetical protein
MRIPAFVLATLLICGTVAPAVAPEEAKFQIPIDGTGLLDYCGQALNALDAPSTQMSGLTAMKFGWCLGFMQATMERITYWKAYVRMQEVLAQKAGKPTPSLSMADEDYASVCLPPQARVPDLIRALVPWLQAHPRTLHESKTFQVKEALKSAYACPAPAKDEAKPAEAKP